MNIPQSQPQPSSSPMLYDELITEILSQLPVKSLLRFRCVCKSWKFLFSDSTFVKLHLQRSRKHAHILLQYYCFPIGSHDHLVISCSVPSLLENPSRAVTNHDYSLRLNSPYFIVGSCNGLVCLLKSQISYGEYNEYCVRFWNPAMGLRSKRSPCLRGRVRMLNGVTPSVPSFGFGYDDSSDCYKVVAVMLDSEMMDVKVHCMGDTRWRMIGTLPSFPILSHMDGVFVGGALNWVALRHTGLKYHWGNVSVKQLVIFSFHLGKNMKFKYLSFPEGINELPSMEPSIAVLRDCLCLFLDFHQGSRFELWQMKEFGVETSWTRLVVLQSNGYVTPLCLSENGDMVLLSDCQNDRAILYNTRDNRVVLVQEHPSQFWMNSREYVQSMILPC